MPERRSENTTAQPSKPITHEPPTAIKNAGTTPTYSGWIGPTGTLLGGIDSERALAFSMATITATRIMVISATVVFGKRNSERMEILLLGTTSRGSEPVRARKCS